MAGQEQEFGTKFNQKVTVGRMVHYVMKNGEIRPAVITKVWRDILEDDPNSGMSNLRIMTDVGDEEREKEWRGSVNYAETGEPNTWHWPPKV
ncbi:hypothetical protein [Pararhizobium arenae]|uniref:hypothetical protein n=1 Tax=Pararhizobium arenae TaxID=1856850 RepID=UPI00094AC70A|nr:hypothetical protein [Pararhizobium arenae]